MKRLSRACMEKQTLNIDDDDDDDDDDYARTIIKFYCKEVD